MGFVAELWTAARRLGRGPVYALTALSVLGLGIGVTAGAFAIVTAVLEPPSAAVDKATLVRVYAQHGARQTGLTIDQREALSHEISVFASVASHAADVARVRFENTDQYLAGEMVSAKYFAVLGVWPSIGRLFDQDDDARGEPPVVVISHHLWTDRFAASADVVGRTMTLGPAQGGMTTQGGRPYTIVGVAPEGFRGTISPWERAAYWIPLQQRAMDYECQVPLFLSAPFPVVARLAVTTTAESLRTALADISVRFRVEEGRPADWRLDAQSGEKAVLPLNRTGSLVPENLATAVMVVAFLVLAVASVNVGGLVAARSISQRRNVQTLIFLGATRWQLVRRELAETCLLMTASALLGLLVARILVKAVVSTMPTAGANGRPIDFEAPLSLSVIAFAFGAAGLAALIGGFWPVWRASLTAHHLDTSMATPLSRRARSLVVLPQLSFAVGLVVVAGTLVMDVLRSESAPPGYSPIGLTYIDYDLSAPQRCARSSEASQAHFKRRADFGLRLLDQVTTVDGVRSAAIVRALPFEPMSANVVSDAVDGSPAHELLVERSDVSAGFFETMEVPIRAGRSFGASDGDTSSPVAIVSAGLAQTLWPNQSALGRRLGFHNPDSPSTPEWREVVGIAGDLRNPLDAAEPRPRVYVPLAQGTKVGQFLLVKTAGGSGSTLSAVESLVVGIDSLAVIRQSRALSELIERMQYPRRAAAAFLGSSAGAALSLAAVGLFGVLSVSVQMRTRELAIRSALGAGRNRLSSLVLFEGLRVGLLGITGGSLLGLLGTRWLSHSTLPLPALDLRISALSAGAVLFLVSAISYVPARRASRIDPNTVLKEN